MKAFRVEVNFNTGKRAGGIDPKGTDHICNGSWQDNENGFEYRLFRPDADVEPYRTIEGVEVFDDLAAAEMSMTLDNLPEVFVYFKNTNPQLSQANMISSFEKTDYDAMDPTWTDDQELEYLFGKGISGIVKIERKRALMADIFAGL